MPTRLNTKEINRMKGKTMIQNTEERTHNATTHSGPETAWRDKFCPYERSRQDSLAERMIRRFTKMELYK